MVGGRLSKAARACAAFGFALAAMCTVVHAADQERASTPAAGANAGKPGRRAPKLEPAAIKPSKLTVRLDWVGRAPSKTNLSSPVAAGNTLLLIDQWGWLDAWDGANTRTLLSATNLPAGVTLVEPEGLLNVAANADGSRLYVMFTSSTVPGSIPQRLSPRPGADAWHVLYRFDFDGTTLSNPVAITALQVRHDGHTGGGLTLIDDSTLLFATGDNGDAGEDGRTWAQDPANHLSKLVSIDVATGATNVVAIGVRNVQHLIVDANNGDPHVVVGDIGGWIAEEIGAIRVDDLFTSTPLNLGWGRNDDGKAREGTFYIDVDGTAVGAATVPESRFVQPIAQFGREGAEFVAVTGPVASDSSFNRIRYLLGDLVSGSVYALTGAPTTGGQSVNRVALIDSASRSITLRALAGGGRPDPRFFNFADGTAGVLLEATGDFYRLTEVR